MVPLRRIHRHARQVADLELPENLDLNESKD
jgi:hypothetical protein